MRRLCRMRHLDDLAAQLRGLPLQRTGVDAAGGLANQNIHRPLPIAALLQGLWTYFAGSLASSFLNRSAQRMTSSMPRSSEMVSRQPNSLRSFDVSSM